MKVLDLVENAKKRNPKLFAGLPDRKVAALAKSVMQELRVSIEDTTQGEVRVDGFGMFKVRNVERERDGNVILQRRVSFRPLKKPPAKKGRRAAAKRNPVNDLPNPQDS